MEMFGVIFDVLATLLSSVAVNVINLSRPIAKICA